MKKKSYEFGLFVSRVAFVIGIMYFALLLIVMLGLLMHNGYLKSRDTFNLLTKITASGTAFFYAYIKYLESKEK